ncbi:OsmC family protein [Sinorhizobium sp. 8-89]|uniref:OsmC family protein n=1 Tax=Sinorhizobium sp. 7-81 TaxID=3049087 RepID=UPI0024C3900B|nr:OsmC family protein [Sinorhizobium sp. 7-81]MDK1389527.1 OsmC family protein [Sinorhizobium sp. 7-81]
MSTLREFLQQKRAALLLRREWLHRTPDAALVTISASATAEGRSGIRRIRLRDLQIVSDSPANFAGYDLGATSPELLLGALSSCLTHTYLIQAADLRIPLDDVRVNVSGQIDPRAGTPGFEDALIYPHEIRYIATVVTEVEDLSHLNSAVERFCPVFAAATRLWVKS